MNYFKPQNNAIYSRRYENTHLPSSPTPDARAYLLAALFQSSSSRKNNEKTQARLLIAQYANLRKNWNENGADPIPCDVVLKAFEMIDILPVVPDIFPTACGTIQFEYEKEDGSYLELELEENKVKIFTIDQNENECLDRVSYADYKRIRRMVATFNE